MNALIMPERKMNMAKVDDIFRMSAMFAFEGSRPDRMEVRFEDWI